MKTIRQTLILLTFALFFAANVTAAPLDERQRTVETVVADALAQLPAATAGDYDKIMGELAATGAEGVGILADMLVPASQGENAAVEYALNGVATDNADVSKLLNEQGIDPATVACKTGTAEYTNMADTAWFACYAPVDDPQYVVACVVEHGGGGSAVAAPLGAKVLAAALASESAEDPGAGMGVIAGATGKVLEGAGAATSGGRTD